MFTKVILSHAIIPTNILQLMTWFLNKLSKSLETLANLLKQNALTLKNTCTNFLLQTVHYVLILPMFYATSQKTCVIGTMPTHVSKDHVNAAIFYQNLQIQGLPLISVNLISNGKINTEKLSKTNGLILPSNGLSLMFL